MGTGASVALSSSDFCILSSNLLTLLTVLALSRSTFNKSELNCSRRRLAELTFFRPSVLTNFVWAASFNTILVPIAAGAFYDLGGIKLPPVSFAVCRRLLVNADLSNFHRFGPRSRWLCRPSLSYSTRFSFVGRSPSPRRFASSRFSCPMERARGKTGGWDEGAWERGTRDVAGDFIFYPVLPAGAFERGRLRMRRLTSRASRNQPSPPRCMLGIRRVARRTERIAFDLLISQR